MSFVTDEAEETEFDGFPTPADNAVTQTGASKERVEEQPLAFEDPESWLNDWALPHYRRPLNKGTFKWDPSWWKYEEATTLITALWMTFEQMRWEGATGMASYMSDYFYPLMGQLTASEGPFWEYDPPQTEEPPATWPTTPLPEELKE